MQLKRLESHLWEAANSPVDRMDWKRYILPLLFFKRICDVWDEEYQETVELYGEDFADEQCGVFSDAQWSNKESLPDPLLKDLIEHFSSLPLGNKNVASDIIGDA